jgi:L-ribulose-5-phosphate 3-epimerase
MKIFSRREMLVRTTQLAALYALSATWTPLLAEPGKRRFKIGACDWSIGKMANPQAFELAKEIGLDGVQVSLGTAANDMQLRRTEVQRKFQDAARATGLEIASLAIGELNEIPYKSDPRTEVWVSDCVDVWQRRPDR